MFGIQSSVCSAVGKFIENVAAAMVTKPTRRVSHPRLRIFTDLHNTCMHVCICVHMYVCLYLYIYIYTHAKAYTHVILPTHAREGTFVTCASDTKCGSRCIEIAEAGSYVGSNPTRNELRLR